MKTTMDLPEDLIREMKLRAVREGRKLREVAEEFLRRGLAAQSNPA
jgi:plasmid stability protein